MANRTVTIQDVARYAGVSRTTVSDALNGTGRVSESTREAVTRAADELGYRPNTAAKSLRTSTTGTIGIHLPEAMTRIDYYLQIIFGALETAAIADVDVTLITSRRLGGNARPRVDGVIVIDPLSDDAIAQQLLDLDVPIVTLEQAPGQRPDGVVTADHEGALTELLEHLGERGARAPALLASPAVTDWGVRIQQRYREWCAGRGIPALITERPFGSAPASYAEALRDLFALRPDVDGVICGPAGSALVALDVLEDLDKQVGRDVLVAALVDSTSLVYTDPPITAIDLSPRAAGAACVEVLIDLVRGRRPRGGADVPLPIRVEYRASTAGDATSYR
ncbi:LacI family DNA-binding transcriptional regulator [Gulosibacter faecalis]|uniref:LacI family DNA-binding transcriptional regulator n=1 Tax=Gulosibacter faecalis TaxID=272240 RepID=A0ABW5UWB4_9MICO|nr:LacI family DNA-binding transcriptional regulator [Gulosibacter faecalis]